MRTTSSNRTAVALAAIAMALAAAGSAYAQDNTAGAVDEDDSLSDLGNAIVVTAQRREERLQDVPLSITAFSGDALQSLGVNTTQDLTQVTPGLNFTQSSYSPQPTIRGIGTRGVSSNDESVVPVYIDGVYQPSLSTTVTELNNIERVEVLRGPQTALYGRNSTGGAINIVTATPSADPQMKASISYGTFHEVIAKAFISGGTETFQGNVALLYRDDDGYLENVEPAPENDRRGWSNSFNLMSKLRFSPSDRFEAIASVMRSEHSDTLATSSQPYMNNTTVRRRFPTQYVAIGPYQQNGTGGELTTEQSAVSLTAKLHLDALDVVSISAYDDNNLFIFSDVDGTQVDLSSLPTDNYSKSFNQEVYVTSASDGPFQWIVGGNYFHRKSGTLLSRTLGLNGVVTSSATGQQITDAIAVYAQGTYNVSDALSVTLAGRYTNEKKDHTVTDNLARTTFNFERTFNDFSPSATVQYKFSEDANIYARAGKGFKSGLFPTTTIPTAAFPDPSVEPEKVIQYELGGKVSVNRWLSANVAGFYTDYSNIQVNVRDALNRGSLQNAAKAELYGIEGEIFAEPIDRLNLRLGITKLWGEFKDYPNAAGNAACTSTSTAATCPAAVPGGIPTGGNLTITIPNAAGNKFIRTPFFTISAGVNYAIEMADGGELSFNSNVYHASKEYRDADNRVTLPGFTTVNAELGYRLPDSDVKFTVWARNLFDEVYNVYILTGATADTTLYAKPRTVGVRLDMKFGG